MTEQLEIATLAGGCFWCTEAVFKRVKGVIEVTPGYTGGHTENPSYDDVCSGTTGHAEAIQVKFDPTKIDFESLLDAFFAIHDPTTLDRQGNDVGTQYRSAIFYHNSTQQQAAEAKIRELEETGKFSGKIVTQVTAASDFYKAEKEHIDFYDSNRGNAYCRLVIDPKVQKLLTSFSDKVKDKK